MIDDLDLAWEEQEPGRQRRGRPPSRQVRRRRRRERKRRRRSFGALFISFLLLAGLGFGTWWGVGKIQDFFGAPDYTSVGTTKVKVLVKPGDTSADIGNELYSKQVIKSAKAFVVAAKEDPRSKNIQPGTYTLFQPMPARQALSMLLDPEKYMLVNKVTLREGLTVIQTFKKLSEATGIPEKSFADAAKDPVALGVPDYWFKRDDGKRVERSIEGFLFPDTYRFDPDLSARQILEQMVNQFLTVVGELKFAETVQSQLSISPFEALIVASLAQVEAGNPKDLGKVARVAYNRAIKDGWTCKCLEFDVTVNYWLERQGKPTKASKDMTDAELDNTKNPWNTGRSSPGLPVGPISNPGRTALQGAMNPPAGPWIYFVAVDKEGNSKFAVTLPEHEQNIALACRNGVITC
jgi:UPF0755 protein